MRKPNGPTLPKKLSGNAAAYEPERVSYNKSDNRITVLNPNGYLAYLIQQDMFTSKKISVYIGSAMLGSVGVRSSETVEAQTLVARRDPNSVFNKVIYLEAKTTGTGWDVKTASTLDIERLARLWKVRQI
ncbi:uncharacterized protein Z519_03603 [Cladophialophora bantiana CBS 173.52]|uniref:Unplaced genomic scaffold supercont1.34, whole genome shotgun sequence n=1 Tax=Cladophialophora bantiana (strain ATCC 10958 / CBS 173.52 / CDC B-1940 / NIH 8579) TaxID=1442370 RepID=A0A0D2H049_CLAB1|nr:uncharacterized protein Z519_12708 [Cladophialophora bantiana CBS 173.52]XP_016613517.1 uncharacterized protein Z519_12634 [Cladophialophora bantiana CBS 173.52]XP_016617247.1 uncharacterized protein Z519_08361 [Cladophialophora bantiana CBS 173.52]XP_016618698.1 uncharacterized protein Z519_07011 [Cladophialophora bantiana CBS 173.52]XP_016620356.1 uncharacterized protein Z519_06292 [Cladophialophora bantiana CBS 173.52]XP_016621691.1 uncharacterized protein Z519_03603 [Cladophialophora ba